MAQVTDTLDIEAMLTAENPGRRPADIAVYADALRVYCEAADNVRRVGAVATHPRTGAPFENPYLKIQERQGKIMRDMRNIASTKTLAAVQQWHAGNPHD